MMQSRTLAIPCGTPLLKDAARRSLNLSGNEIYVS